MGLIFDVPKERKIRVIVDTDAYNEADDQFAIAHHIMTPCFDIRAFIGAHFEKRFNPELDKQIRNIPHEGSMDTSYNEILKVIDLMGKTGQYRVLHGAKRAMKTPEEIVKNEGSDFIVEEAMSGDGRPLFVCFLGTITDLAAACLTEPRIADHMTAVWIGGGQWPAGCHEFNLSQDLKAANVVMGSKIPLWQIPINAYQTMRITLAQLQARVRPRGKIGKYLYEQMTAFNNVWKDNESFPQGEAWVLGDQPTITVLLDPHRGAYTCQAAPFITDDCFYVHKQNNRSIRVYHSPDSRMTLEDFFAKLKLNYPEKED
jgi:hypothetical protein